MLNFWYIAAIVGAAVLWVLLTLALVRCKGSGTGRERRTEYDTPDFSDAAGFRLSAYPDDEINIPRRYWLIEDTIAEIDYAVTPDKYLTLRAAKSGQLRPPRGYEDIVYEREESYQIGDVTVTPRQSAGRRTTAEWTLDGFDFMIYSDEPEMNMVAGLAHTFVTTVRAELT